MKLKNVVTLYIIGLCASNNVQTMDPSCLLYEAIRNGNLSEVKKLIAKVDINSIDGTVLHIAAEIDTSGEILKTLIDAKANLNLRDKDTNSTPLHTAIVNENVNAVRILLESCASVNQEDYLERTPLHITTITKGDENTEIAVCEPMSLSFTSFQERSEGGLSKEQTKKLFEDLLNSSPTLFIVEKDCDELKNGN